MWLYHYNNPDDEHSPKAAQDGFAGFIPVGHEFEI